MSEVVVNERYCKGRDCLLRGLTVAEGCHQLMKEACGTDVRRMDCTLVPRRVSQMTLTVVQILPLKECLDVVNAIQSSYLSI